jgi:hypothetical protein
MIVAPMTLAWKAVFAAGLIYSAAHFIASGILFPLSSPNVGQIIEELQPLLRLFTRGEATVDHPRQYGPIFLMLFHWIYKRDLEDPTLLSYYAYALDMIAIVIAFVATVIAVRDWAASRGHRIGAMTIVLIGMLWANFSPLYGVLAIKNVEIWELACIAVAGAALLRKRTWLAAWSIAAGTLIKMLPLVFLPYLWLRHRRAFYQTLGAMAIILALSQLLYGTQMGFGYFGTLVGAAGGGGGYGNPKAMIWHENVSLRGVVVKGFGFLEKPGRYTTPQGYSEGYHLVIPEDRRLAVRIIGTFFQGLGLLWAAWMMWRRRRQPDPDGTYWDWAFVGIMMLVMAPQVSQDYMVLTLVAFTFVMVGCILARDRAAWIYFGLAVLLVANVIPRGAFGRLLLIDHAQRWSGYEHLLVPEAYQFYGFPLLGLLLLTKAWWRLSERQLPAGQGVAEPAPAHVP